MKNILYIYLKDDQDVLWWLKNDSEIKSGFSPELSYKATGNLVVVIAPMSEFSSLPLDLKVRSKKQLTAAIPFALEERLNDSIDELHFTAKTISKDKYLVWVTAKQSILQWKELLLDNKITIHHLIPESALFRMPLDGTSVWLESDRAIISQNGTSILIEPHQVDSILKTIANQNTLEPEDQESIDDQESIGDQDNIDENISEITKENSTIKIISFISNTRELIPSFTDKELDITELESNPLIQLAQNFKPSGCINVLHGEFANPSKALENLKPLATPAVLATVLMLITSTLFWNKNSNLEEQINHTKNQTVQVYKNTFPNKRVVNAKAQMKQKIKEILGNDGLNVDYLNEMLSKTGKILIKNKEINVKRIGFRKSLLTYFLEANDIEKLEGIYKKIKKTNYNASLKSVNSKGNIVTATIEVRQN